MSFCGVSLHQGSSLSLLLCFREHCLCFLSIYSSLCLSHPPSLPLLNHVTLWTQRVTSSSSLLPMQSATTERRSVNYKYTGRVLSMGFLCFLYLTWSKRFSQLLYIVWLCNCHTVCIITELNMFPAVLQGIIALFWSCVLLLQKSQWKQPTKYWKWSPFVFFISHSHCLFHPCPLSSSSKRSKCPVGVVPLSLLPFLSLYLLLPTCRFLMKYDKLNVLYVYR